MCALVVWSLENIKSCIKRYILSSENYFSCKALEEPVTNITFHLFAALNCFSFIYPGTCLYGSVSGSDFTLQSRTKSKQLLCKCLVK